ncbi:uncharacterized protein [Amphiura filiformis]|uniref:uncharacterized protein n=1 Tax=Amphiura filiformis TaxID=82378 RepID=UPI003B22857F
MTRKGRHRTRKRQDRQQQQQPVQSGQDEQQQQQIQQPAQAGQDEQQHQQIQQVQLPTQQAHGSGMVPVRSITDPEELSLTNLEEHPLTNPEEYPVTDLEEHPQAMNGAICMANAAELDDPNKEFFMETEHAFRTMRDCALRPVVKTLVTKWHKSLKDKLHGCTNPGNCPTTVWEDKRRRRKEQCPWQPTTSCQCCKKWSHALEGGKWKDEMFYWNHINPILLHDSPVEAVKVYIKNLPKHEAKTSFDHFDVCALLKILRYCPGCDCQNSNHKLEDMMYKNIRCPIDHHPTSRCTKFERNNYIDMLVRFTNYLGNLCEGRFDVEKTKQEMQVSASNFTPQMQRALLYPMEQKVNQMHHFLMNHPQECLIGKHTNSDGVMPATDIAAMAICDDPHKFLDFRHKLMEAISPERLQKIICFLIAASGRNGITQEELLPIHQCTNLSVLLCMEKHKLLGENNLVYPVMLFHRLGYTDLEQIVTDYAAELSTKPLYIRRAEASGAGNQNVEFKIENHELHPTNETVEEYRHIIAVGLKLEPVLVKYNGYGEGCIILVFELPESAVETLEMEAREGAGWLVSANIIGVHIETQEEMIPIGASAKGPLLASPKELEEAEGEERQKEDAKLKQVEEKKINAEGRTTEEAIMTASQASHDEYGEVFVTSKSAPLTSVTDDDAKASDLEISVDADAVETKTEDPEWILKHFLMNGQYWEWSHETYLLLYIRTKEGAYTQMFDNTPFHAEQNLWKKRDEIKEKIATGDKVIIYQSYSPCNTANSETKKTCADRLIELSEYLDTHLYVFFPQIYRSDLDIMKEGLKNLHKSGRVKCEILQDWREFYNCFTTWKETLPRNQNQQLVFTNYLQELAKLLPEDANFQYNYLQELAKLLPEDANFQYKRFAKDKYAHVTKQKNELREIIDL